MSVLIVNWNTREATLQCLDALAAAAGRDGVPYEAIVVENGSGDGSREALAALGDVRLIANETNRGFAAAVNQAYRASQGELVLLLNSDVELRPGALAELVRLLECRPGAAAAAPTYLNPDGSFQHHHYRAPSFAALLASASGLRRLPALRRAARRHRMLDEDFTVARPVEQPSASCLLLRRSALAEDDLLDEGFPIYFNDVELAARLRARGLSLWMTPDAVVVHELGASTRLLRGSLVRHHLASLLRYAALSQPRARVLGLKALVLAETLLRFALRRPGGLSPRDLIPALRGEPGPCPQLAQRT